MSELLLTPKPKFLNNKITTNNKNYYYNIDNNSNSSSDKQKPKMALQLAQQFNKQLLNLNFKWNGLNQLLPKSFHNIASNSSNSNFNLHTVNDSRNNRKFRRRCNSASGDPKEFDVLVMKTIDWDEGNESF
jgi:hypothetical protein